MNIFNELVLCMNEQELLKPIKLEGKFWLSLQDVLEIRRLEKEIIENE